MDLEAVKDKVTILKNADRGNPRIHPNGFIQLDLDDVEGNWHESHKEGHSGATTRLHIWNPPGIVLPHQETTNEVHDHVFDMHSTVVKGIQWQLLYHFIKWLPDLEDAKTYSDAPLGRTTHEKYRAVYNKSSDSRLEPTGEIGWLGCTQKFAIYSGDSYSQPAFTLHDSKPQGCTVTVMKKTHIHSGGTATVVCPIDFPPDNSFDRASAMPKDEIWKAIEVALEC